MGINKSFLLIKAHFFLFMGGAGAVVPYLVVFGKQLGISAVVMGTINGLQPLTYIVIKPLAGVLMDYFHKRRKIIFSTSILLMAIFCFLTYFALPSSEEESSSSKMLYNDDKNGSTKNQSTEHIDANYQVHQPSNTSLWIFLSFNVLGMIMFNICNSYSDTICFDVLGPGNEKEYGKQRVWGGIGYGVCACLSGVLVEMFSKNPAYKNNSPAYIILIIFAVFDLFITLKLKPSPRAPSGQMFKDVLKIIKNPRVVWFLVITLVLGMCDSFLLYFVLWYLEDVSIATGTFANIRMIEGFILLGETLLGETIFFHFSGYIIDKIGYNASFVLCLLLYTVRFGILSIIPNVWWAIPSECIFQASFALGYTLVVSYTNYVSTPGVQATMQSVSMSVFDGLGYAVGSFSGGLSLRYIGGRGTFALMSLLCLTTATLSVIVFACFNWCTKTQKTSEQAVES